MKSQHLNKVLAQLAPQKRELASKYFDNLFRQIPDLLPLIQNSSRAAIEQEFCDAYDLFSANLGQIDVVSNSLKTFCTSLAARGMEIKQFQVAADILKQTLFDLGGSSLASETKRGLFATLDSIVKVLSQSLNPSSAEIPSMETNLSTHDVLQALPVAAFAVDAKGTVTQFNPVAEKLLGLEASKASGKKSWTLFFDKKQMTPVDEALSDGSNTEASLTTSRAGEQSQILSLKVTPMMDASDECKGAICTLLAMDPVESRLKGAIEGSNVPMMMVDRDFQIIYVNPATINMMKHRLEGFQKAFPGFTIESLLGSSIDRFHRNPSHQRQILSNPSNLPHEATIQVLDMNFSLHVSGVFSEQRDLTGYVLEWHDITELRQSQKKNQQAAELLKALDKSQGVIEFDMAGIIVSANDNFLSLLGYSLDEIKGKHHRIFVSPAESQSLVYREFWDKLNRGEYDAGEYRRIGKNKDVWIQASYNPVIDENGKPYKVIKYAADVTEQKLRNADFEGKMAAISKAQAVIEFKMDGTILHANENFCTTLGYDLSEIVGKHHRIFVDPAEVQTGKYLQFWEKLNRGEFDAGEYKRIGRGGKEVWIQASYNPILGLDGKPYKVVKFATDITATKLKNADYQGQLAAIGKSQAVIEFDLDGTVLHANENFCSTLGYALSEIVGKHHRIFVDPVESQSPQYKAFWEKLNLGEYDAGEYRRIGKGGKEVWIQASYNPIMDMNGKPFKVVKYATDITQVKLDAFAREKASKIFSEEVEMLTDAGRNGNLTARGDLNIMDSTWRPIMEGINAIIDTIVAPIDELKGKLERVASGDLTAYVTGNYKGDHQLLKNALNDTLDSLNDILGQVAQSADQVANGARQVSDSSQALSQGATEQASSLEEITASMTEMSSQTKQNAENASQANQLAGLAREGAERGNGLMADMVKAMAEIDDSSQNISKIIKAIDEIAFQTNLLALNAAVEAARAGVHGKGFAVVAEEVRNLAARSAKAAKETTEMIEGSIKKVNQGSDIARKTAEALVDIVSGVGKVTDLVGEIAAASNEQAQGIAQVNQGLTQLDSVTQQNTSSAEESAAASEQLSSQSSQLRELLGKFTLQQHSSSKALPAGITPEMFAALQAFMAQQSRGSQNEPPFAPTAKKADWSPSGSGAQAKPVVQKPVIALDDSEFGKF